MSDDKFKDQRVYDEGYRAGWNGSPREDKLIPDQFEPGKTILIRGNPYRGSTEFGGRWDLAYDAGQRDRKKHEAGEPLGQPVME